MLIMIDSAKEGWTQYVLYGTKSKPRKQSQVRIIDGDTKTGDLICNNLQKEDNYYRIVLGFSGKPSDEIMVSAYIDFKNNFFAGYEEDEYHLDAVIHKDTDDYHIHVRVPKYNLLTNKHLQLYYHDIDMKRKDLLQNYIAYKYDFEKVKKTLKTDKVNYIQAFKEQFHQKKIDIKTLKSKSNFQKYIYTLISNKHQDQELNSFEELKLFIKDELNLDIIKFDYDRTNSFYYITIQNETGKMRLKGDLFNKEFWDQSFTKREVQIHTNKVILEIDDKQKEFDNIQKKLQTANQKRAIKVKEVINKSIDIDRLRAKFNTHKDIVEDTQTIQIATAKKTQSKNVLETMQNINILNNIIQDKNISIDKTTSENSDIDTNTQTTTSKKYKQK